MSIVDAARALARDLPSRRASHDSAKQLDADVVEQLRSSGLLGCLVPQELGGLELDPVTYVETLEALAIGDSATAWCVMTASTSTLLGVYVPRTTAASIWRDHAQPFFAGVFAPNGKAVPSSGDEGLTLTGHWSFGSGSRHAAWFVLGCIAEGKHTVCLVPASVVKIVDNWNTLGLAGTGSHDLVVEGVHVPATHVTSVFTHQPWTSAPLYRVPLFGLLAMGIVGCGLGIARSALDHAGALFSKEAASTQLDRYARLRAQLDAARAYVLAACDRAFAAARGGGVTVAARAELRLAASYGAEQCAEVARGAFHLAGGAAARIGHPIHHALRDLETLCTHRMVQDRVLPATARGLLGGAIPPDL